jgi:hypothetical protein
MTIDKTEFRKERIEKLLHELCYEIERGVWQKEIDETLSFDYIIPYSRTIMDGVVKIVFRTNPMPSKYFYEPRFSELIKK